MRIVRKNKVLTLFLAYGAVVGLCGVWWWRYADSLFLPNIPGMLLGDKTYSLSIGFLGNPSSEQAHYTIPWVLRIPQVYIPVSVILWGLVGLTAQFVFRVVKRRIS